MFLGVLAMPLSSKAVVIKNKYEQLTYLYNEPIFMTRTMHLFTRKYVFSLRDIYSIDPKFSRKTSSWLPISMKHISHSELALQAERVMQIFGTLCRPTEASTQSCSVKNAFTKFTGKHPCRSLLLIMLQGFPYINILKTNHCRGNRKEIFWKYRLNINRKINFCV